MDRLALLAASLLVLLSATGAIAANSPVTFGQFVQDGPPTNSNLFTYIDNGPGNDAVFTTDSGGVTGVAIPVIFTFQPVNGSMPADLTGPQDAMLTLTASTTAAVDTGTTFRMRLGDQEIYDENDKLTITRDSPAAEGSGSRTNLLTMTFTGALLGRLGSATPNLSGNTNNGDEVSYASDFLMFVPSAINDFNMAFSSWTTLADGDGLEQSPSIDDNNFGTATAAATATFDSSFTSTIVPLPEPATFTLGAMAGLIAIGRRRSRSAR